MPLDDMDLRCINLTMNDRLELNYPLWAALLLHYGRSNEGLYRDLLLLKLLVLDWLLVYRSLLNYCLLNYCLLGHSEYTSSGAELFVDNEGLVVDDGNGAQLGSTGVCAET